MENPAYSGGRAIESFTTQEYYQLVLALSGIFLS